MTGTANQIPEQESRNLLRRSLPWLIVIVTAVGIFFGGVTSGYFMFRAESLQRTEKRDRTVNEIKQKLDSLPQQTAEKTADKVKQVVQEDEGK
ncbi:hypothetical protein FZI51_12685 [Cronobacter sakazakii]|uniref:hypothetical protein n=1 Tax=Cronobacter sakazakii TaxID=28141 RepID=UPI0013F6D5CB|nr:hypothetical protein [Cronobacter sakazakii]EJQ2008212.1 hypothetical protein [Cronobacter sakazakii]EJQ2088530.1 hypothetical protein [Cronobacter sakazakii]EJR9311699.1 hypothetical protein [Cronobacter sakazakii]EJR9316322.1 hypothetical protein [Cronobacter sakazakii]EJR9320855.1 hypothetical protein [Cronobacter sakazakii]